MFRYICVFCLSLSFIIVNAEGTKELRPASGNKGNIEINDCNRPFALESNNDTLHRLFIHINNISEKIYFGFQPFDKTAGIGTFRIKNPVGTIVYDRTDIPVVSGDDGYINSYAEAVVGPQISGLTIAGYKPLSLSPTTTGDYYIEFTSSIVSYQFDLFDITVVDSVNNPINGRLWSYAWDLSTRDGTSRCYATMFIYTADKYTTSVNLNGIQPWGFVVSSNSTGPNSTGNTVSDRKSIVGNHTRPEYKVFLNQPDPLVYPSANAPVMIEDLALTSIPISGEMVTFYLNMNKSGMVELFLGLDGVPGYQPGNKDIVIVKNIKAGGDIITWDGKDLTGNFVSESVVVEINSRFATGTTHLPIYDAENLTNGFIVNRITPVTERASVYWDDVLLGGSTNIVGASGNNDGHVWTNDFGNNMTINTWWNGYENDNLKSFTFRMDGSGVLLPISLSLFSATVVNDEVNVLWQTSSERNNDFFEVQRSINGIEWESLDMVDGAGTTTAFNEYSVIDKKPIKGLSYYRLKQVDYDGKYSYSNTQTVSISNNEKTKYLKFNAFPNPALNSITIELGSTIDNRIEILTIQGQNLTKGLQIMKINATTYTIDISKLEKGSYILSVNGDDNLFLKE